MTKRRVECPECGFIIRARHSTVAGVRSKRKADGHFEYTGILPDHFSFDDGAIDHLYTIGEQALLTGLAGLSAGALVGFLICQPFPVEYSLRIIPGCALGGLTVFWSILANERLVILGRALPWFAGITAKAEFPNLVKDVTLTVNHLHRDGLVEANKTIQRFGPLPVDVGRFNEWVQGVLVGKSLGVTHWTPKAKMFTRPEYDLLLGGMKAAGIVVNEGSNKGNVLTIGGRRALTRHLKDCGITPPSPVSENDFLGERLAMAQANNGGNTPLPHSGVCAGGQNAG